MKTFLAIILTLALCGLAQAKTLDFGVPTVATTGGATPANVRQLILIFSTDFAGSINGTSVTSLAGGSLNFATSQAGDVYGPITYTVTAGTMTIFAIQ